MSLYRFCSMFFTRACSSIWNKFQ